MLKPATVRISEEFFREISNFVKKMKLDKSGLFERDSKKGIRGRQAGEIAISISGWRAFGY
jgi:hypothetical protein